MPRLRNLSFVIATLTVMAVVINVVLLFLNSAFSAEMVFRIVTQVVLGTVSTGLGLFVARRRPANPVGFVLTVIGFVPALILLNDTYIYIGLIHPGLFPSAEVIHQFTAGLWVLWYMPIMLLVLIFPDGKLPPGPFPRLVLYGTLIDPLIFAVLAALEPSPYSPPYDRYGHPLPTLPPSLSQLWLVPNLLFMTALVCAALVMRRRYRAAGPVERAQVKWFRLGALALPGTLLLCWIDYLVFGEVGFFTPVGLIMLYLGVPSLTTLAILRHDLYDVDRATSAVVTWGLVVLSLLTLYSLTSFTGGLALGRGSAVTAAAVTALIAVGLVPVKNRIRRWTDRRFYPVRQRALAAITALQRDIHDGRAQPEQLQEVLREALRAPELRIGFLLPGGTRFHDTAGVPVTAGTEVRQAGRSIGVIDGPCPPEVTLAGAPLVETVRLRLELRQALGEVEASRGRLLRAGYRERRRLERDLHDGAQSRLVTLGMALRLAQRHLGDGSVDVNDLLDQTVTELATVVTELRELAHGLRPSSLDDGLGPALEALTMRAPVRLDWRFGTRRLPDDLATTAYFVASEAVTNAVKHAKATSIGVVVDDDGNGGLRVTVRDDGRGGADPGKGSGLSGLTDRVDALGGRLHVTSAPGEGTTVEAVLPCAS